MPFMTREQFDQFDPLIREGMETLQAFSDPDPLILRRRDTNGNFATITTFTPIDVKMADRLEQNTGANTGRVEIINGGTMRMFAPPNATHRPRRDDRLVKDLTGTGPIYEVTFVEEEERGGVIPVNFRRIGG